MGKLCVVINGPSLKRAQEQIRKGNQIADLLEFRLDLFQDLSKKGVLSLLQEATLPVIFTLKEASHLPFLALKPDYADLDSAFAKEVFLKVKKEHPTITLIASYHDAQNTPKDLATIAKHLGEKGSDFIKIATFAKSALEALRVAAFSKNKPHLIALAMGPNGQFTRVLSGLIDNPWTYAPLEGSEKTAPGQLFAHELLEHYHYREIDNTFTPFALLGGELVAKSPGHKVHNAVFKRLGQKSVYVKIPLFKEEVQVFLDEAYKFGFQGFSVTMPLKEVPWPKKGPINTIKRGPSSFLATNTDGMGALDVLEEQGKVANKHVVILGAGGAAKACAKEALKRGAKVTFLNRTVSKAKEAALPLKANYGALQELQNLSYDILVQATSVGMRGEETLVVPPSCLHEGAIVLDMIIRPKQTPFLHEAKKRKAKVVFGEEMFIQQAIWQYAFWFDNTDRSQVATYVRNALAN